MSILVNELRWMCHRNIRYNNGETGHRIDKNSLNYLLQPCYKPLFILQWSICKESHSTDCEKIFAGPLWMHMVKDSSEAWWEMAGWSLQMVLESDAGPEGPQGGSSIEETILSHLNDLDTLVKIWHLVNWPRMYGFISEFSILFHWSIWKDVVPENGGNLIMDWKWDNIKEFLLP